MENLEKKKRNHQKTEHIIVYIHFSRGYELFDNICEYSKNGHVQNCVQWPFVMCYSSRFGTVRVKVMMHSAFGGLSVTAAVWMDLWMDGWMDGCLHCRSQFHS